MTRPAFHRRRHRRRRPSGGRLRAALPLRISVIVHLLPVVPAHAGPARQLRSRHPLDITKTGWWTVLAHPFDLSQWTLQNYDTILSSDGIAAGFVNSLIVTIPATVIPITVAAFAAYAFAWMRFPFRRTLFIIVVGLLVVPLQMALIPVLQIYSALAFTGTFLGVWLAHTGFGLPLAIFLLYNFMSPAAGGPVRDRQPRRRDPFPDVHARSCCRSPCRRSRRSPSSSSCGSGTTCWWPSCSWGQQ